MKSLFLILIIAAASCCGSKKTESNTLHSGPSADTIVDTRDPSPVPTPDTALPACISKMIQSFKAEEVQNPPRKIFRYSYKGNTVYYVPAICCDFFSDLYDAECKLIGHPDGGFTGKGDGKLTDFEKERSNEQLVWADPRKR